MDLQTPMTGETHEQGSVTVWVKVFGTSPNPQYIYSNHSSYEDNICIGLYDSRMIADVAEDGFLINDLHSVNKWMCLTLAWSGGINGTWTFHKDGVAVGSGPYSSLDGPGIHPRFAGMWTDPPQDNFSPLSDGVLDEGRISSVRRSANWIWASWSNQVDGSTFCNYGEVEVAVERDTDGDGMPDVYETRYGFNVSSNDAAGDADGDGMSNYGEYRCNTDPTNALSVLRLEGATPGSPSEITLIWQSVSGKLYSILIGTDLLDTVWDVIESNLAADPPTNFYPVGIGSDGDGYYRIKVE